MFDYDENDDLRGYFEDLYKLSKSYLIINSYEKKMETSWILKEYISRRTNNEIRQKMSIIVSKNIPNNLFYIIKNYKKDESNLKDILKEYYSEFKEYYSDISEYKRIIVAELLLSFIESKDIKYIEDVDKESIQKVIDNFSSECSIIFSECHRYFSYDRDAYKGFHEEEIDDLSEEEKEEYEYIDLKEMENLGHFKIVIKIPKNKYTKNQIQESINNKIKLDKGILKFKSYNGIVRLGDLSVMYENHISGFNSNHNQRYDNIPETGLYYFSKEEIPKGYSSKDKIFKKYGGVTGDFAVYSGTLVAAKIYEEKTDNPDKYATMLILWIRDLIGKYPKTY